MNDTTTHIRKTSDTPFIIDAHEDIAWNWLDLDRHPRESALESRQREVGTGIPAAMGIRTTGLPEWLAGRVGIIIATIFVMPARHATSPYYKQVYTDANEAYSQANHQLDSYRRLVDEETRFRLLTTRDEFDALAKRWESDGPIEADRPVGLVLSIEGADPIRQPAEVHEWYEKGVRLVGPSWAATRYAGGSHEPGPLTDLGKQLLQEMAGLNMVLDLSHMATEACRQAIDLYPNAIIASHSNPRRFSDTPRNLSDELIQRLAARDGVVGILPFNLFLRSGWRIGDPRDQVTLETVIDAIDHVAQLTGSSRHVGLGSDLDGAFGAESMPPGLETVADLPKLAGGLADRGYTPADIALIMNGNWQRILRGCLP